MTRFEQVDSVNGNDVDCKIKNSATLAGALFTLHASQIHIDLPTLTEKDKEVSLFIWFSFSLWKWIVCIILIKPCMFEEFL